MKEIISFIDETFDGYVLLLDYLRSDSAWNYV